MKLILMAFLSISLQGAITAPTVKTKPDIHRTEAARAAGITGHVRVSLMVDPEGKPSDMKIVEGLGYGLDEEAVSAVAKYTFEPSKRDGVPVKVRCTIEVNFR